MDEHLLKEFLGEKTRRYNSPAFIINDPVSIPHLFRKKEDREIAGFLAATIAWGQRPVIISNSKKLMELMQMEPYEFVMNAGKAELYSLRNFKHRTFNGTDLSFFIRSMKHIYSDEGGLEMIFSNGETMLERIAGFRKIFFRTAHQKRSEKHISDPSRNSSAKRINMFLRWMVRKDKHGVDFGIWKKIPASDLMIPLDVHVGNTARTLGLLTRKQDDWKAVEELTAKLREFDPDDPVKYDYALFGVGVNEGFRMNETRLP